MIEILMMERTWNNFQRKEEEKRFKIPHPLVGKGNEKSAHMKSANNVDISKREKSQLQFVQQLYF